MGLEPSGPFDTHPSNGDRIRRARQAAEPGVFHLELPARCLFSDFEVISRQVTLLHYNDDLALPLELAHLVPVSAESGLANVREESAPSTPERGPRRIKLRAKG